MRTIVTLLAVVVLPSCQQVDRTTPKSATTSRHYSDQQAQAVLKTGDCQTALQYLEPFATSDPPVDWYDRISNTYYLCSDGYRQNEEWYRKTLQILDRGLQRHPRSSRLLKSKGERFAAYGQHQEAQALFEEAFERATENLAANPKSEDDRRVLMELRLNGRVKEKP